MTQYLAQKTIEGKSYQVLACSAMDGINLGVRIAKILGPTMATWAKNAKADVASDVFGQALAGLFNRLEETGAVDLVQTILNLVMCNGKPIGQTWNVEYAGKLAELVQIVMFAGQAQFQNFAPALGAMGLTTTQPAPTPPTTTLVAPSVAIT